MPQNLECRHAACPHLPQPTAMALNENAFYLVFGLLAGGLIAWGLIQRLREESRVAVHDGAGLCR